MIQSHGKRVPNRRALQKKEPCPKILSVSLLSLWLTRRKTDTGFVCLFVCLFVCVVVVFGVGGGVSKESRGFCRSGIQTWHRETSLSSVPQRLESQLG